MDAEWSSLPPDLIRLIANQLPAVEDYAALTAVSRSFRSATKNDKWCPTDVSPVPWLLLSPLDDDKGRSDVNRPRGLSSMYRGRKKLYLKLPELHNRRCWGSAYGWIISLGLDRQLQLFNPLTRRIIVLPKPKFDDARWKEGEDYKSKWMRLNFFNRCMLIKKSHPSRSSTNFLDDFFVVIAGPLEGLFRVLKHDRWEDVSSSVRGCISDFISYKDQFYALGRCGQLFVCSNFDGPDQATASLVVPPDPRFMGMVTEKYYIVELMGELVMVVRYMERQGSETPLGVNFVGRLFYTLRFEVFKLDMEAKKWVKIEDDLGGCALFVGDCPSISLSRPEYFNCRSNCVYYTDDNYQLFGCSKRVRRYPFGCVGGYNTGIFDFKEGRNESLYQEHPNSPKKHDPVPKKRLTAEQVLEHPWLQNATSAPNVSLGETVKARLKQFSVMNKLKKRALRVIADHLSEEEVNGLKEAFEIMDINERGKIDLGEFRTGLQKLGHPMAEEDLLVLMEVANVDGDGALNYGEFVAVAVHLRKMGIEEHLHTAFTFFDRNQSGFIEIEELRDALSDDDDAKSEEVINAIMHDVDTDKDGCISYEEFAAMMKAGTDWRKASRQYSRDRFNSLSLKLMKDGSVKIANEGR